MAERPLPMIASGELGEHTKVMSNEKRRIGATKRQLGGRFTILVGMPYRVNNQESRRGTYACRHVI